MMTENWTRLDRVVGPQRIKLAQWDHLSDHCAILFFWLMKTKIGVPFHSDRFIDAWLNHSKFGDLVKQFWTSNTIQVQGWDSFIVLKQLQGLKAVIRDWNRNVFGNAETQIKKADDVLYNLDLCLESRGLNADEKTLKNLHRSKDILWRQKARMTWLKLKERNRGYT